ncbi:MAG: hypothetical protein ABR549_03875 [Mycobacteriales bacterium]
MGNLRRVLGDVALALLAVVVLVGVVVTLQSSSEPAKVASVSERPVASVSPSPTALTTATSTPTADPREVAVVGPDLVALSSELETALGGSVDAVTSTEQLSSIDRAPDVVVVQILAGTKTSARTASALAAVAARWPKVTIDVVGPFSANDRKSAEAVRKACTGKATFVDPVTLHWRADATTATLSVSDRADVATALAKLISA